MPIDTSDITLPVTITSSEKGDLKKRGLPMQETFSAKYGRRLHKQLIYELGAMYYYLDGRCFETIYRTNLAIELFCEYCLLIMISSIDDINSTIVSDFLIYLKHVAGKGTTWVSNFSAFRCLLREFRPDVHIPVVQKFTDKKKDGSTEAHSIPAFRQMILALRREIDRFRRKIGLLEAAKERGRILTLDQLRCDIPKQYRGRLTRDQIAPIESRIREGNFKSSHSLAREYNVSDWLIQKIRKDMSRQDGGSRCEGQNRITRDDVVATIMYYLPAWPIIGRPKRGRTVWRVYKTPKGVLLGEFDMMKRAYEVAKKNCGHVVKCSFGSPPPVSERNPGDELLLPSGIKSHLGQYLRGELQLSGTTIEEEYFATYYDMSCVLMYWLCITGWNAETARSVSAQSLGFTPFKKMTPINLLGPNIVAIYGDAPMIQNRVTVIRGTKRRSQPADKPKPYRHISDLEDNYGLYRVLSDYYKLSEPLRRFLRTDDLNCALIGVSSKSGLCVFGPSVNCSNVVSRDRGRPFFLRNEIYDIDGTGEKAGDQKGVRVLSTNTMMIRASYSAMLESLGVPPWIRKMFLGHETMDTTVTSYGVERVGLSIRMNRLREKLNKLEKKAFKGDLKRYDLTEKRNQRANVIQIWEHNGSPVFICKDRCKPTWKGHEKYVRGNACQEFGECLFCKQCQVTVDSLPFLLRWLREIKEWTRQEGFLDTSLRIEQRRKAIEEVIDQCRDAGRFWSDALINADMIESGAEFSAPPFWMGA